MSYAGHDHMGVRHRAAQGRENLQTLQRALIRPLVPMDANQGHAWGQSERCPKRTVIQVSYCCAVGNDRQRALKVLRSDSLLRVAAVNDAAGSLAEEPPEDTECPRLGALIQGRIGCH